MKDRKRKRIYVTKKQSKMELLSTKELIDILSDKEHSDWDAALAELKVREVPDTYEVVEMRGGIRPTHPPSH